MNQWEYIGFQNGNKPQTDTRAVGILGPMIVLNFLERIWKIQDEAQHRMKLNFPDDDTKI